MLLLITNRKSHTHFWVPNSKTLIDREWPWTAIIRLHYTLIRYITGMSFGATTKIWMKIDPYCQRQKCRLGILVSSKIRFLRIFAGVRWTGGFKWERGRWQGDFRFFRWLSISRTFTYKNTILYCNILLLSDCSMTSNKIDDLEWL